jgi:hypothetical protein
MNQSDQTDDFFREQVRQLQSKGHSPEAVAEIVVQVMKQKLLEQCENGEPLADQDWPSSESGRP